MVSAAGNDDEWNRNKWESLSELEWDASATEVVRDTTKGCSNAVDTLPFGLILKESANSSLSVWTQKVIEKGTKFGPLQGDIITEHNSWKLRTAKRSDLWPVFAPSYHVNHYIDTSPLFGSNWMRYVAFPGASCPHNLVACQVENAIYFFARENIPAFTELKVWFHPNFFDRMKSSTVHNIPWTVERQPFQNHHNFFDPNKISIRLQDLSLAPSFPQNRLHFLLNPLHDNESFDKIHLNKFSANHFQRFHPPSLETSIPVNGFLRSSMTVDDGLNSKTRINHNILLLKKEQEERKLVLRSNSYKLDSSNESSPSLMKHEITTPPNSASLESINSSNHSWSCSEASSRESISLASEKRIIGRNFSRVEETSTSNGSPKKARETRRKSRGVASLPYELPRKNGKTIYECRVCKKVCAQLSNLKVHMYTHTGERPYGCSQCPSRFTQKAHLQKHMSTHTGVKPFSCPICGKKSASSSNIKAHMKVHEGR